MQTRQYRLTQDAAAWDAVPAGELADAQLVLAFGPSPDGTGGMPGAAWFARMAERWPDAARVYCSTGGHVADTEVVDGAVVVTVVRFAHTGVRAVAAALPDGDDGTALGAALAAGLPHDGLRHVLVFTEALRVNGHALVRGMAAGVPPDVQITGGLAGDDDRLGRTVVALGGAPSDAAGVAVGLYGDRLAVGAGALGGWETFGPARLVTRSERELTGSLVHELDGEPALALYKRYLGPLAAELPASGLLFPLALRTRDADTGVVRMVLGIDEAANAVRFAGDVPEGAYVRLMKTSPERLIDAASEAAGLADAGRDDAPGAVLALVVSCVGRRWVLRQRVEEELEAVRDALGGEACLAGFYSYGEVAPADVDGGCEYHTQTMTLTTVRER